MLNFLNFYFTPFYLLTFGRTFPLLFPPPVFPELWINNNESEPLSPIVEEDLSQNQSEFNADSMEKWFETSSPLYEYEEDEFSITQPITSFPVDPDEMYSPHLHDKYFTSKRNRNTKPPYYANGSVVVINQEYFRTRDSTESTLCGYEDNKESTTSEYTTNFPDPDEMYSPHLHDKYFTSEDNRNTKPPYYADGSTVVINGEYYRILDSTENTIRGYEDGVSATEYRRKFPDPDEMYSPHLHDKYFTSQHNRNTEAPYYANGSVIVINHEYFRTKDDIQPTIGEYEDEWSTTENSRGSISNNNRTFIEEDTKSNSAPPFNGNSSSFLFNRTFTQNLFKRERSNVNEEITHSRNSSEDWSNPEPAHTLSRIKRDLDELNNTYEDMSWGIHQQLSQEAMEDVLETSTLSASEEKLYRYYETKTWPTLNSSSITSGPLNEYDEYEDEKEWDPKRRIKYEPDLKTVSSPKVNFSLTLSSQYKDSTVVGGSTKEMKVGSKIHPSDLSTTHKVGSKSTPVAEFLTTSLVEKSNGKYQQTRESTVHKWGESPFSKHEENQLSTTVTSNNATMHRSRVTYTYSMPTPPPSLSESQENWYAAYDKKLKSTLSMDQFRPGDPTWWKSWPSTFWNNFTWTTYPPYHPFNATTSQNIHSLQPLYNFRSYEEWKNYTIEHERHINVTLFNYTGDSSEDYSEEYYMDLSAEHRRPQKHRLDSQTTSLHKIHSIPTPNIYLTPSESTKKKIKVRHYRGRGKLSKSVKRPKTPRKKEDPNAYVQNYTKKKKRLESEELF